MGSEEYLAKLGFDTSDMDASVNRAITILGHLGNQFDQLGPKVQKAERALSSVGSNSTKGAQAASRDIQGLREQLYNQAQAYTRVGAAEKVAAANLSETARAQEFASQQTALYNQYLYDQEKALKASTAASPALRYALYDVASTALIASAAITGVGVAAAAAAASYESSFTGVERTLRPGTASVADLRNELLQLTREIPLTFQQISEIATLGNQMGIAGDQVDEFTETVARFSAVTGLSIQETSLAFGQLGNLLGVQASEYENLGSSIALVGVNSAATEAQIVSVAREIAPAGRAAGFTADQIIGLSGALASIKVPPERSRSTVLQFFETLNSAVATGGQELENFATVIGVSSAELDRMVRQGEGESIFRRFIDSAAASDTVAVTQALQELGLAGLRTNPTIRALADNTALLDQTFADARGGFIEGTELSRQYALVVDDLASRWQIFVNNLMTFAATVGAAVAPALTFLLDTLSNVLIALSEFASTPIGQGILIIVAAVAGLVAILASLVGVAALARASMIAIQFAMGQLAIGSAYAVGGINGVIASLIGLEATASRGAVALRLLRLALVTTGVGAIVVAVGTLVGVFVDLEGSVVSLAQPLNFAIDLIYNLAQGYIAATGAIAGFLSSIPVIGGTFKGAAGALRGASSAVSTWANLARRGISELQKESKGGSSALDELKGSSDGAAGSLAGVGNAAGGSAAKVRSLVDYANDLSQVINRAFDIRFGGGQAFDSIQSGWIKIRQAIESTNDEIAKYRAEMLTLASDKAIREYWLRVAENYGDSLRAGQLRAEIAEIDAKLAKTTKDLSSAQDKNSKTLEGNTEGAIANREEILGLVKSYQGYITSLASAGLPAEELARRTAQLKADFIAQATQLGYNSNQLAIYAAGFDDVAVAIAGVPRNITVSANVDPALQALNELRAQAQSLSGTTFSGPTFTGGGVSEDARKAARAAELISSIVYWSRQAQLIPSAAQQYTAFIAEANRKLSSGSYRSGTGWTGSGNPWEVAGVVHNRERVLNERGSRIVSEQFVNAANQGRNPWQYAPQGGGSMQFPSTMTMELSPVDRDLIAQGARVTVVLSSESVARATSGADGEDNRRGGG